MYFNKGMTHAKKACVMLTWANFALFIGVWICKECLQGFRRSLRELINITSCWSLIQTPCCRLTLNLPSICTFISSSQWWVPAHLNEVFCRCPWPRCLTRLNLWSVPVQGSNAAHFDLRLAELTLSVHPCCLSLPGDGFQTFLCSEEPVKLVWVEGYLVRCALFSTLGSVT